MVNNISDVGMMILIIKWQVLKPLDYYRFRYLVIYSWRLEKWCLCLCLCFQIIFCHTFIPRSFTLMTLAEKETSDPWPVSMEVLKFYLKIVWDVFKKIKIIKKYRRSTQPQKHRFLRIWKNDKSIRKSFFFHYIESTLLMCITIESKNCQRWRKREHWTVQSVRCFAY